MSPRAYLARTAIFGLAFALMVIVFNWLVDPYAVFGTPRISGLNANKIDINNFTRLSKRYQPGFDSHNALIVGNSRVELGINPAHPCLREAGWKTYNLGLPGASVRTQLEYALNVMHQQAIEQVFISVDFTDFISSSPLEVDTVTPMLSQQGGELKYLPGGQFNPQYPVVVATDYYKSLFTLDSLVSSFTTVIGQSERAPDRDESGFNPGRDFAEAVRVEGAHALFAQKTDELERKYSSQWYLRDSAGRLESSFGYLSEFLVIAGERGVAVHIFTNPLHDSYWALLERRGMMPLYADWLASIERLVMEHEGAAVTFWDFSANSGFIHEPLPEEGVGSEPLQWFWEPAHYREELGSLMLDAMLSESCNSRILFGRKIL